MSIKLSACTLGYNRQTTVEEAVRRIAKTGYKAVDLYTGVSTCLASGFYKKREGVAEKTDRRPRPETDGFRSCRWRAGSSVQFQQPA